MLRYGQKTLYVSLIGIAGITCINILLAAVSVVKDSMVAAFFGTTGYGDMLFLSYFIPDAIGWNIIGQTVAVSLIPAFSRLLHQKRQIDARCLAINAFLIILACTVFISLVLLLSAKAVLQTYSGSLLLQNSALIFKLFLIILPVVVLIPVSGVATAYLNSRREFIKAATAPVVFNAVILVFALSCLLFKLDMLSGTVIIAVSILVGAVVMTGFLFFFAILPGTGVVNCEVQTEVLGSPALIKPAFRIMLPYALILISGQAVLLVERFLAADMNTGSISALTYAYRLAQFPVWVFTAATATAVLPDISSGSFENQYSQIKKKITDAVAIVMLVVVPSAVLLWMLRVPLISLLFERGAFNETSKNLTASIIPGYSVSIVFQSLSLVALRVFIASGKIIKISIAFVFASILNIIIDFIIVDKTGAAGLGWGAAAGWIIIFFISLFAIDKMYDINILNKKLFFKILVSNAIAFIFILIIIEIVTVVIQYDILAGSDIIPAFIIAFLYFAVYIFMLYKLGLMKEGAG